MRKSQSGSKASATGLAEQNSVNEQVPAKKTVEEIFADIEKIRKKVKPLPKGMTVKDLIEEGRR
jgi:hypothetical protein